MLLLQRHWVKQKKKVTHVSATGNFNFLISLSKVL